jgi:hypothetical protein
MTIWHFLALGAVLGIASAAPARAQDLLSAEKVKEIIAGRYDVEVLRVTPVEGDAGPTAYRVTVMVPPGDSNSAFMVSTLVVDATTGDLISQFRHLRYGYELPPAGVSARENSSVTSRRETFRPHF